MNREIKFRAWDRELERFHNDVVHMQIDLNGNVFNFQDGAGPDVYEISQYTGLKDKNGKEIYEGDIVEITDTFHTYNLEIKWDEYRAGWGFAVPDPEEYGYLPEWHMEIKGNRYENPDLLKS